MCVCVGGDWGDMRKMYTDLHVSLSYCMVWSDGIDQMAWKKHVKGFMHVNTLGEL